jgi:hypothetical protein
MRATIDKILLGLMLGCFVMTSVAYAQQASTQYVSNGMVTSYGMAGQEQYVPNHPQAIYTNSGYQIVDPMAQAEYAYAQPMAYGDGGFYPGYYGAPYAYGYQPCPSTSYSPGLTCGQWYVGGWIDQGATWSTSKAGTKQNAPMKFNDRFNEYQLNQMYLTMGRSVANSGCRWDLGGRVDLLYGADYLWTSAIGLETHTQSVLGLGHYTNDPASAMPKWNSSGGPRLGANRSASRFGLAMPQLYAELYLPVHCGLNIKFGHFYSIMGYESVMSPQNFFYSHSYSMMYGQPMTHTGVLFSQRLTHRLTGIFGVTRGWDTWEDPNGKLSYLAGFRWNSWDQRTEFSWVAASGNETVITDAQGHPGSLPDAIRTNYSMVLSHQLTPRLKLVTQHDMGYEKDVAYYDIINAVPHLNGHWYSVSQYVFYQLTNKLTFGIRGEWFRDVNHSRILGYAPVGQIEGSDYSQITVGLNWKPYDCLVIRPEARWDWSDVSSPGGVFPYRNHGKKSQNTISLSAMVTF